MSHHGCEGTRNEEPERKPILHATDYTELREGLQKLPMTWYPDLILSMVTTAYEKKVFQPNGASRLVRKLEDESLPCHQCGHYPCECQGIGGL